MSALELELFSAPGCTKCGHAKHVLKALADSMGGEVIHWREVNILEEIERAVALGVMSTPAIAINGELVFAQLPSAARLKAALEARMDKQK